MLLIDLVSSVGTGVVVPFLAVYAVRVRGHPVIVGGMVVAALAVGSLLANVVAGRAVDRWGAVAALRAGWLLAAAGDLALLESASVFRLLISAAVIGVGAGAAYPALRTLLAEGAAGAPRRLAFAMQHGLLNVGLSAGAILAAVVISGGSLQQYQSLYVIDAGSFVIAAILLAWVDAPPVGSSDGPTSTGLGGYREVAANPAFRRFALLSGLLVVCGYAQFHAALPLYLSRPHGLSPPAIAMVYAANTATVVVAVLPVALAVQRLRYAFLISIGAATFAVSWAVLALSGNWGAGVTAVLTACLAASIMGVGEALLSPALGPLLNDIAPDRLRGRYNAADAVVLSTGSVVGPLVAATLFGTISAAAMFVFLIGGCAAAAAVARPTR